MSDERMADVAVVGAGAAGLMTAIACARHAPDARIVCFDGARTIGAKILVSGGSRCNVTNRAVTERDFWSGCPRVVRDALRAFPAERAASFFEELGVALREEAEGKLFPESGRARTVLDALLAELARRRIELRASHRVEAIEMRGDAFAIVTSQGVWSARVAVMATGGRSLPKSGSDGYGYDLARRLGHGHVDTTPALVPLIVETPQLRALSGVALPAGVTVKSDGATAVRLTGALLWTHFGASGPVVLNASRHWARGVLEGRRPDVVLSVLPGETFERLEAWLLAESEARPRAAVTTVLASRLPAAVADAWLALAGLTPDQPMAHLTRAHRRRLIHLLIESPLDVRDTRGYTYAEATSGGVPLDEIDPRTMESRRCPRLYLVGEMLDVDGRIGGFNFQWAWSSGWVAGQAIAAAYKMPAVPRGLR
jgi:predicted Rossmann fold flavoprotein